MAIPQAEALKGKKKKFAVSCNTKLAFGDVREDFGALLDVETEIEGEKYNLAGWIGNAGKTEPVVAKYVENPGKSQSGEHDLPSLRIYAMVNGVLREMGAGFNREAKKDKKAFITGRIGQFDLTFWHHEAKEEALAS